MPSWSISPATAPMPKTWLQSHGYPNAVLDEVTADAVAADVVEGRTAA